RQDLDIRRFRPQECCDAAQLQMGEIQQTQRTELRLWFEHVHKKVFHQGGAGEIEIMEVSTCEAGRKRRECKNKGHEDVRRDGLDTTKTKSLEVRERQWFVFYNLRQLSMSMPTTLIIVLVGSLR